ncbi:MAG TPA: ATP-binding cassette domain-containing protein [Caulobacteraceae bacterium]|nr:ATP-binding cassette domain-containing protein [Caulobacteraceae bacterium]
MARLPSLRVEAGQAALILGPSGAGKTTLLLAIAGLVDAYGGSIQIDGVELTTLSAAKRDRFRGGNIGLVFQDIHLIPGLSALDNVLLSPYAAGLRQDREMAMILLDRLGLKDKANRPAQTLSRGQAQRAAIARAMLLRPKLILADEPTASLDDEACQVVGDLLISAAEQSGAALLISTHDQRLKARVSQTVAAEPIFPPSQVREASA